MNLGEVTVSWKDPLSPNQERRIQQAVVRAAALVNQRARVLCSVPAVRETRRRTRDTSTRGGGPVGSSYTVYRPSPPGSPPALRTGVGRSAITWWLESPYVAKVGLRGGKTAEYMKFHETGTRRMPPRPWLARALKEAEAAVKLLLNEALKL